MESCETFIRGTIRFSGFSFIISIFHDQGMTSDEPVPSSVKNLRDLYMSRLGSASKNLHPMAKEAIKDAIDGMPKEHQDLTLRLMSDIDVSYLPKDN